MVQGTAGSVRARSVAAGSGGRGMTRSGWVWCVAFGYGGAVVVRSDRLCCVALRYVLAVEVRSVVLRQVEVWVGSVTAVGARSGLDG